MIHCDIVRTAHTEVMKKLKEGYAVDLAEVKDLLVGMEIMEDEIKDDLYMARKRLLDEYPAPPTMKEQMWAERQRGEGKAKDALMRFYGKSSGPNEEK